MHKIKESLPALAVIAALLAGWWLMVIETHSVIFPTPWQVVTGTTELIKDGTLWMHIGASLMRVGVGFSLAVVLAVPPGLSLGWAGGRRPREAYAHAHQRSTDVHPEGAVLDELRGTGHHLPGRRENDAVGFDDHEPPAREQGGNDGQRRQTLFDFMHLR